MFAVSENLHAVDEDMHHASGKLMRLVEGRVISDFAWVEDHHVGKMPRLERAALVEAQIPGRQRCNSADGLFERNDAFVPDISSQ